MNQENLKMYYEIYTECWKLFKKYCNPEDTEEFWKNLAQECRNLTNQFGQTKLACTLAIATYNEIVAIWKGKDNG